MDRFQTVFKDAFRDRRTAISIANPEAFDCPLVYVNGAFAAITGYDVGHVIGRNCRFLQGAETDPAAVEAIRTAAEQRVRATVCLKNYRKDGVAFDNMLVMSPLTLPDDDRVLLIGCQYRLTRRTRETDVAAHIDELNHVFRRAQNYSASATEMRLEAMRTDCNSAILTVRAYAWKHAISD